MTDSCSPRPDRSRRSRRPYDAFDVLIAHPSLASLSGQGSRLDRLPAMSTGTVFVGSMFVSLLMFGAAGAVLVIFMLALPLVIAVVLSWSGEMGNARGILRVARGLLVFWAVVSVLLAPSPALESARKPIVAGNNVCLMPNGLLITFGQ
jgi:hypothetical protein